MCIIVMLDGGLGNQLFQYAAGRSLANILDTQLYLDDSMLKTRRLGVTPRDYELGIYNINAKLLDDKTKIIVKRATRGLLRYIYKYGILKTPYSVFIEKHYQFDPYFFQLTDNTILTGYWQSSNYFMEIRDELCSEIQLPKNSMHKIDSYMEEIKSTNSISLHIRRGDYIANPKAAAFHYLCDVDYYLRAIDIMAQKVRDPIFYIFSDDPDWAENELSINYPVVMVSKYGGFTGHEDLALMSSCKHHIIANSSFSWWAAWLNKSLSKYVIAPKRWFKINKNMNDLLPNNWLRI